jgi:hypothetical protein
MASEKPEAASKPWRGQAAGFVRDFFDFSGDNALPFTLGDDDVRVERGEWAYYVRAVHRGQWLRQDFTPVDLLSFVLYIVFSGFVDARRAGRPWKVGVLRRRTHGLKRLHLLHKEVLPAGRAPQVRIAELVRRVESGEFDAS